MLDEIISDSNPGRLHELTDINLLNNDFGVIMKSSHLKEEIKKKLITLDKMKEFTLIDEKTDLHTSINKTIGHLLLSISSTTILSILLMYLKYNLLMSLLVIWSNIIIR